MCWEWHDKKKRAHSRSYSLDYIYTSKGIKKYKTACLLKCYVVKRAKTEYYTDKAANCDDDPKKLLTYAIELMGMKIKSDEKPQRVRYKLPGNDFKDSFITKVDRISEAFN